MAHPVAVRAVAVLELRERQESRGAHALDVGLDRAVDVELLVVLLLQRDLDTCVESKADRAGQCRPQRLVGRGWPEPGAAWAVIWRYKRPPERQLAEGCAGLASTSRFDRVGVPKM